MQSLTDEYHTGRDLRPYDTVRLPKHLRLIDEGTDKDGHEIYTVVDPRHDSYWPYE